MLSTPHTVFASPPPARSPRPAHPQPLTQSPSLTPAHCVSVGALLPQRHPNRQTSCCSALRPLSRSCRLPPCQCPCHVHLYCCRLRWCPQS